MDPLSLLFGGGATLLGSLFGAKGQRPTIDPAKLKELFGPQALAGETQDIYKLLLNSPAFSNIINSLGLQGSRAASGTAANLAASGRSSTPYGAFLNAAGRGYGSGLQRQAQSGLFLQALQTALQGLQGRMGLYGESFLQKQGTPSFLQNLGAGLSAAGSQGFLSGLSK